MLTMTRLLGLVVMFFGINQIVLGGNHKIITNYENLLSALTSGDQVRYVVNLNQCTSSIGTTKKQNGNFGGSNFTNFNKYKIQSDGQLKNVVATSINVLVQSEKYGPVYNYVRLRVFEDGTAELFSEFLDPRNYTKLNQATFNCRLSDGQNENGLILYNLS